ncbi:MAG TPA: hypothetical protein ENN99_00625 [Chloroflexi bacterium]|nr:hypothetical protein [Chloroflexota bacterium]
MFRQVRARLEETAFKSWLGIAGLWGAGLLPCPDCGAPMLMHFWPVALVLTLVHLRRKRCPVPDASHDAPPSDAP